MSQNDLRIKIVGSLNIGKSINEINSALKGIEKKINKLKLNVDIDKNILKAFSEFNKQTKKLGDIDKKFKETTNIVKQGNNDQLKSISDVTKGYEKLTKQVEKYNAENKKVGEVVTVSDKKGVMSRTIASDGNGKVTGYTDTFNYEKDEKQRQQAIDKRKKLEESYNQWWLKSLKDRELAEQKSEEKLINQMAKGREKAIIKQQQEEKKLNEAQAKSANQNAEKTKELEHQLQILRQQSSINVQNLQRTHGGFVDKNAIQSYLNSVNSLNAKTPNLNKEMQNLNMQFRQIQTNAKSAAGATQHAGMSFKEMLSTAMTKFPINFPGGNKTSLIAGIPLEPFKLQRKDEISLNVNV